MLSMKKAHALAVTAHGTQKDKVGEPYIHHLEAVALGAQVLGADCEVRAAALLHDVVEDTKVTLEELRKLGASERQLAVVAAVTKSHGAAQKDYLDGIVAAGPDAMRVKLADLLHNTRPDRLALLTVGTRTRLRKKYAPSIARLMQELGYIMSTEDFVKLPVGTAVGGDFGVLKSRPASWLITGDVVTLEGKEHTVKAKAVMAKVVKLTLRSPDGTTTVEFAPTDQVVCRAGKFAVPATKKLEKDWKYAPGSDVYGC